jgi:transcriptional regulator with XRE-family HTH domain
MVFGQVTQKWVMVPVVTETESEPLAVVIGRNFRRIRDASGVTQNELAKCARTRGLRWTASKVGDFEAGRVSPTFATVLVAVQALAGSTETDVALADLVQSDGFVSLTDNSQPRGSVLQELIRGERSWNDLTVSEMGHTAHMTDKQVNAIVREGFSRMSRDLSPYPDAPLAEVAAISERGGLDEDRVAKRLNISTNLLAAASWHLWRRSFSEERDRRAGSDANPQKRGRVSRELQHELSEELARGDD